MTSQAQAVSPLPGVRGLVFFGFPLHPAGKPADERAAHLAEVQVPMLFLQGTRDELAELALLQPRGAAAWASAPRCSCCDDADHSFHVPARSGRKRRATCAIELLDALVALGRSDGAALTRWPRSSPLEAAMAPQPRKPQPSTRWSATGPSATSRHAASRAASAAAPTPAAVRS